MKQTFRLAHAEARRRAAQAVQNAPDGFVVTVGEPTRNLEQNAAQWPILEAFARKLTWPINGDRVYMTAEDWKDVLTATFRGEQARLSQTLDGRIVMLGQRTREFGKRDFSEWLDFLNATAAMRGVELERATA